LLSESITTSTRWPASPVRVANSNSSCIHTSSLTVPPGTGVTAAPSTSW